MLSICSHFTVLHSVQCYEAEAFRVYYQVENANKIKAKIHNLCYYYYHLLNTLCKLIRYIIYSYYNFLFLYVCIINNHNKMYNYVCFHFQALSIIISCIRYHHPVSVMAALGIVFVFVSLFVRFYCSFRLRSKKNSHHTTFKV